MPSKLREKFLGMSGEVERRDIDLARLFIEGMKLDIPELVKEQVAQGGSQEEILAALVLDAIVIGYVGGRRDERAFVQSTILHAIRKARAGVTT